MPPPGSDCDPLSQPIPILLFAKLPVPGEVKTRVARAIGADDAARLATALLLDSVERFGGIAGAPLYLYGDQAEPGDFERLIGGQRISRPFHDHHPLHYHDQGTGSLGARLRRAFADPPGGGTGAIAIGADAPHLDPAVLADAAAVVRRGRVALGPALDGGYYLIGVPCGAVDLGALFPETGWGEAGVLEYTRSVLGGTLEGGSEDRSWQEFAPLGDIDEWEDVVELARLCSLLPGAELPGAKLPGAELPGAESADRSGPAGESHAFDPRLRGDRFSGGGFPPGENPSEVLPRTVPLIAELLSRHGASGREA